MALFSVQGAPLRAYQGIQLGWEAVGAKHFAGDGRTPEGHYAIDRGLEGQCLSSGVARDPPRTRRSGVCPAKGATRTGRFLSMASPMEWPIDPPGIEPPGALR